MRHIYHLNIGLVKAAATRLEMIESHLGTPLVVGINAERGHGEYRAMLESIAGCAAHRIREYIRGLATINEVRTQLHRARDLQVLLNRETSARRLRIYMHEAILALESVVAENHEAQRMKIEDLLRIAELKLEDLS